mgnify:CR=1 FL=1
MVASEEAKTRVLKMGEDEDFVFNTGCPSIDIAYEVSRNPKLDFNPGRASPIPTFLPYPYPIF